MRSTERSILKKLVTLAAHHPEDGEIAQLAKEAEEALSITPRLFVSVKNRAVCSFASDDVTDAEIYVIDEDCQDPLGKLAEINNEDGSSIMAGVTKRSVTSVPFDVDPILSAVVEGSYANHHPFSRSDTAAGKRKWLDLEEHGLKLVLIQASPVSHFLAIGGKNLLEHAHAVQKLGFKPHDRNPNIYYYSVHVSDYDGTISPFINVVDCQYRFPKMKIVDFDPAVHLKFVQRPENVASENGDTEEPSAPKP